MKKQLSQGISRRLQSPTSQYPDLVSLEQNVAVDCAVRLAAARMKSPSEAKDRAQVAPNQSTFESHYEPLGLNAAGTARLQKRRIIENCPAPLAYQRAREVVDPRAQTHAPPLI